jgi:DNA invertase Pin-like site-specific DNA recombinase
VRVAIYATADRTQRCRRASFESTPSAAIEPDVRISRFRLSEKGWSRCRGWTVAGEYVGFGISGTKEKREALDRLMSDAHRRRFDCVVWKFDRFARSVSHLLRALETFKAQGIEFVSFSEQMDTSTPAGKMVFTVLGAVELKRSLIVERVKAGLRNARAKGKVLGRPKRVVDARRIAALRAQGAGWKRIAAEMGIGVGTLYRRAREGSKIRERVF